jgi:hypothetical protein
VLEIGPVAGMLLGLLKHELVQSLGSWPPPHATAPRAGLQLRNPVGVTPSGGWWAASSLLARLRLSLEDGALLLVSDALQPATRDDAGCRGRLSINSSAL